MSTKSIEHVLGDVEDRCTSASLILTSRPQCSLVNHIAMAHVLHQILKKNVVVLCPGIGVFTASPDTAYVGDVSHRFTVPTIHVFNDSDYVEFMRCGSFHKVSNRLREYVLDYIKDEPELNFWTK